jgi:hypothetical protein
MGCGESKPAETANNNNLVVTGKGIKAVSILD